MTTKYKTISHKSTFYYIYNMEKYFTAIFDLTKLPSLLCLVIAMAGTFFFYYPEYVIIDINKKSDVYIYGYIAYLVSIPIVLISIVKFVFKKIGDEYRYYSAKKEIRETILSLNASEKRVLREFYIEPQFSLEMPFDDSTVLGLIDKKILYNTSPYGGAMFLNGNLSSYQIGKYARKYINPIVHLGCIPMDATDQEKYDLLQNRPNWGRPLYIKS
ncbi:MULTISPECIES: super-infection exclusion protein B [unclassified Flavobacterium]|uniref:super-infection exclusion protein B n=1 Tax=unclassified Flavobacterium TaxID=196869 RepID=UPI003F93D8A6